ncbi:MAG: pilus assembly protein PilM [Phycisphaerales bacterium]|nr:pilus assembly protein PilM [Phycisphaerales bacterium]
MLRSLFDNPTLPIGIDVGAGGAKLCQLRRRRQRLCLHSVARVDRPALAGPEVSEEGLAELAERIAAAARAAGMRGRRAILSIDDRLVRTRSVRHPPMPDDEVTQAVRLDGAQRLGFAEGEDAEIGWLSAGEVRQGEEVRRELIYVGVPRGPVERLVMRLADRGLIVSAVEPGFLAAGRCFTRTLRRASDQGIVRVVVDVGRCCTGVTLVRGEQVAFHKPLDIGGERLTRTAAERLGLEPATIEDLRERRRLAEAGLPAEIDAKVDRAVFDAVRPLMGDLAHEIKMCLRYYSVTFRGAKPERAYVVGGEALEPRLAATIAEALGVPTSVGSPLEGIDCAGALGDARPGPRPELAAAVGLSLGGSAAKSVSAASDGGQGRADEPPALDGHRGRAAA